ncbi:MAG: hypothetical protein LBN34_04955 [Clostridiales Family XIII bacterium]|nr:hypothetical protein [Clostridiales Family XIII bacterium]
MATIDEQVIEATRELDKNTIYTSKQIVDFVLDRTSIRKGSFSPSDYAYNSHCEGEHWPKLFLKWDRGSYSYVGPNYRD